MKIFVSICLFLSLSFRLWADGSSSIYIDRIQPVITNGRLFVTAEFSNLLSQKMQATIQSGLTSIVKVDITVYEHRKGENLFSGKAEVCSITALSSISYNVWDEYYYVKYPDTALVFDNFKDAQKNIGRLSIPVINESQLEQSIAYSIRMRVEIIPIAADFDQVNAVLGESIKETKSAMEKSQGFTLSMNNLLSLFGRKSFKGENMSDWFFSNSFTRSDLGSQ
ncbi:DUF4390 domain-containing protein [candidate division KSB1 bacterium]|nr:DUF4390 domain-containing protein [candidate division KSB1 bacterium]